MTGSFKTMAANMAQHSRNGFYGLIHNIDAFKLNAFIVSAFIQVVSRIVVAHHTAHRLSDTTEGPYRKQEAIKTTMREAGGFVLSYSVLRFLQRNIIDVLRNYLCVTEGLSTKSTLLDGPTMLNGMYRRIMKSPDSIKPVPEHVFPTMFETVKNNLKEVGRFFSGKPQVKVNATDAKALFSDAARAEGVLLHEVGQKRLQNSTVLNKLVDATNWLNHKLTGTKQVSQTMRLKTFFNLFPILIASVPAVLLSGYILENASQKYAEPVARKIARMLIKKPITLPAEAPQTPQQSENILQPPSSNPFNVVSVAPVMPMPVANNWPVAYPVMQQPYPYLFYGAPYATPRSSNSI